MMKLRTSPASPFGRKVQIAAALLDLSDRIAIEAADTGNPEDLLRQQNPLGKIPVLIVEDGRALYDSRVIVEYLDALAGGSELIPTGPERFDVLVLQALADGLADAALLQVYEVRMRPLELRSEKWVAYQNEKITRGLGVLEAAPPASGALHVGAVALACVLGYLDLRFEGAWRAGHPRLVAWLDTFGAATPAFEATRVRA